LAVTDKTLPIASPKPSSQPLRVDAYPDLAALAPCEERIEFEVIEPTRHISINAHRTRNYSVSNAQTQMATPRKPPLPSTKRQSSPLHVRLDRGQPSKWDPTSLHGTLNDKLSRFYSRTFNTTTAPTRDRHNTVAKQRCRAFAGFPFFFLLG